jgi:hypothetical protein
MTTEKLEDIKGLSDVNHKTDNTMTTEKLDDIKGLSDVNHETDRYPQAFLICEIDCFDVSIYTSASFFFLFFCTSRALQCVIDYASQN